MSHTPILAAALAACLLAAPSAAGPERSTAEGQRFGAPITVKKTVNLAKLQKSPERFEGQTLRIEGEVKNVCQGSGCWVEVGDRRGAKFIARSLDESVLLPTDCQGRQVVVQGVLTRRPAAGHDHAAHAAEAGHSCPSPAWVLATQGAELRAAR